MASFRRLKGTPSLHMEQDQEKGETAALMTIGTDLKALRHEPHRHTIALMNLCQVSMAPRALAVIITSGSRTLSMRRIL